ncbi:MAG: DnaJ domain-containing protein [Acidimicrobiales bacterium]|nr:DnaJ domain-containing protein [Acidimicrobiales bacterium]
MSGAHTHYEVLGVAPDADAAELRRAYVEQARQHHPDRVGGNADRMRAVNEAWAVLGDPGRRQQYDEARSGGPALAPPRRSPVPDPNYDPFDDLDPSEYEDHDFGVGEHGVPRVPVNISLPGWLALIPVALFCASVGLLFLAVLVGSAAVFAVALMTFVLSTLLFLSAPFVALLVSRSASRRRDDGRG